MISSRPTDILQVAVYRATTRLRNLFMLCSTKDASSYLRCHILLMGKEHVLLQRLATVGNSGPNSRGQKSGKASSSPLYMR